ncbi:hypothetical protein [Arthrobacter agilis]|uniref:hypothetical protein n=1 Tax=Arthrobacter agilis TaxID=37921 RepID=UPI002780F0C8|nr:hypothetical protein [Arthrobacter agilis]MDQ0734782.1 hypothetical protein [Arthrobacter agilis]
MEPFEVIVDDELFRVSERRQPSGALSYDFSWLNGPAEGTYGFNASRHVASSAEGTVACMPSITRDDLVEEVRSLVKGFYEPGGMGEDFPDHLSASSRRRNAI